MILWGLAVFVGLGIATRLSDWFLFLGPLRETVGLIWAGTCASSLQMAEKRTGKRKYEENAIDRKKSVGKCFLYMRCDIGVLRGATLTQPETRRCQTAADGNAHAENSRKNRHGGQRNLPCHLLVKIVV